MTAETASLDRSSIQIRDAVLGVTSVYALGLIEMSLSTLYVL